MGPGVFVIFLKIAIKYLSTHYRTLVFKDTYIHFIRIIKFIIISLEFYFISEKHIILFFTVHFVYNSKIINRCGPEKGCHLSYRRSTLNLVIFVDRIFFWEFPFFVVNISSSVGFIYSFFTLGNF